MIINHLLLIKPMSGEMDKKYFLPIRIPVIKYDKFHKLL